MHKVLSIFLVLALAATATPAAAQTIGQAADQAMSAYAYDASEVTQYARADDPEQFEGPYRNTIYEFETRSPQKAFIYSLLIPGAGQLYAGSKIKAAVFFLADVAAWGGFAHFRSSGHTKEDEYRAFADAHWDQGPYWDSLLSTQGIERWHDADSFPHHLPYQVVGTDTSVLKNGEYYENVGKYDQFIWGWDDLEQYQTGQPDPEQNYRSSRRLTYVGMREDANKQFDRATTAVIVSIANHLISAFDAARTARSFNRNTERAQKKLDVKVRIVNVEDVPAPWVNVAYRF